MAGIIKASTTIVSGQSTRPAAFNFSDMGDKANAYLAQVRAEAQQIIGAARAEAEQIKQKAQVDGRQAALKAAEATLKTKLDEQFRQLLPAIDSAAQQVTQAKDAWQRHWEKNLVTLATQIAERVIRREVTRQPEISLGLVREALDLATGSHKITVHLNPEDRAALGDRVQHLAARVSKLGPVQVVSDDTVTRGGCRVHTEFGVIDQQIEAQLKRIEAELT